MIITLIFWLIYISGVIYMAPIFAMQEARQRGRLNVHVDDAVHGIGRAAVWPAFGLTMYTQHVAEKKLSKLPEIRHGRELESMERSREINAALDRQLENKETAQ